MDYRETLKHYFGYDSFRGIQEPIIESIGSGHDTLGLMPTGGGKSITFQVPALASEGVCIVITPLIALMKDQVSKLREKGIRAAAIYSGMSRDAILSTLDNCIFGACKFLYISPERLGSDIFCTKVVKMKVCFITVDESHCISQWGYDFRPSYLTISHIRELLPGIPVLALTATATPEVVDDIQTQLHFAEKNVIRMSFERKNLIYVARETDDKASELLHILRGVPGSAIVYVRTRDHTREVAQMLQSNGITATPYHAGLETATKDQRQQAWTAGEVRVMVATNAFGMGIDKADVRLVVHYDLPDATESYYQEAGRGGRDGAPAYAVILYTANDISRLSRRVAENFPDKDFVRRVYDKLSYHYQMALGDGEGCRYDFCLEQFCAQAHLPILQTRSALQLLTQMGYIQYEEEEDFASRITFICNRDELYRFRNATHEQDDVLRALLRLYPGIFTEYAFVEEKVIAHAAGLEVSRACEVLIGLSRARIISYIPGRKTPTITWVQKRVESSRLIFTTEVYDDRRRSFAKRIEAMKGYVLHQNVCRSRLLLDYFGEHKSEPCGRCDNCRRMLSNGLRQAEAETIAQAICNLLADGEWHLTAELDQLPYPFEKRNLVLRRLADEEVIICNADQLRLAENPSQQNNVL